MKTSMEYVKSKFKNAVSVKHETRNEWAVYSSISERYILGFGFTEITLIGPLKSYELFRIRNQRTYY